MPGPLVWILAGQSLAIVFLLLRERRQAKELRALAVAAEMACSLAQCSYAAVYLIAPEAERQKIPPELRAQIEKLAVGLGEAGMRLMQCPPSVLLQAVQDEVDKRSR